MRRGYSFPVIRARTLHDEKARRDGVKVVEKMMSDYPLTDGDRRRELTKKGAWDRPRGRQCVIEYGPYVPTLMELFAHCVVATQ